MSEIQYAGECSIKTVELISSAGVIHDLKPTCLEINIFEDIFLVNGLTGNLVFTDTNNLLQNLPIIGQEQLLLKITTPSLDDESIDFTENALVIWKVSSVDEISTGASAVTLEFCSQESLRNQRVRVSRSYNDTPSKIIENILTDDRYLASKKLFEVEETVGVRNIISPNVRPFNQIKTLMQECVNKDGAPHYLFYESTQGYNFRTLQDLYSQDPIGAFHNGDPNEDNASSTRGIQESLDRIVQMDIKSANNQLIDSAAGLFGSKIFTHNIFDKSYNVTTYDYFENFDEHKRISETESFPKYNETEQKFVDSRIYVHPTSKTKGNLDAAYADENNQNSSAVANKIGDSLLSRKSRMHEIFSGKKIGLSVHGTIGICAGKMVNINYVAPGRVHDDGQTTDKYISGNYLITKTKHTFKPVTSMHMIHMMVSRDSNTTELKFIENVPEVKTSGKAEVIEL